MVPRRNSNHRVQVCDALAVVACDFQPPRRGERLIAHTEEHPGHSSISDSDHQMIANFFAASVFLYGQLLAISPESKSTRRSSRVARSSQLGRGSSDMAADYLLVSACDLTHFYMWSTALNERL